MVTKGINSYQPISFINMWPLKFKLQSQLILYFLLQRTTWRIVIGRFRFNLSVTFCNCPSTVVNHLIDRRKIKSLIKIWTTHVYKRCSNMGDCCQEKLNIRVRQIDHFMQTVPNYSDKNNHKPSCTCINIKISSLVNLMLQNCILEQ